MNSDYEILHLDCSCSSFDHSIRFMCDPLDPDCIIYTEIILSHAGGFWWRVKNAIKYIFGRRSDYGHFDCFIMETGEQMLLHNFLEHITLRKLRKLHKQTPE
jgi:hypothetical protein